jgi:hypothetical protein
MTVTEKHCRCNGTGVIAHGPANDPDSLEICSCKAPDRTRDVAEELLAAVRRQAEKR